MHHLNARTKATKSKTIPPKSAQRIKNNCAIAENSDPDTLNYFQPAERFHSTFPSLHIMQQTVLPFKDNVDVMVINTSDRPVKLHRNTHLGIIKTVAKTELIAEPMSNYVSMENCPDDEEPDLTRLNNVKIEHMHKGFEDVPVPTTVCNHAFTLHMPQCPKTRQYDILELSILNLGITCGMI